MRNANKSALARELKKQVLPAETIPEHSATIIDGISLDQKMMAMTIHYIKLQTQHWLTSYMKETQNRCGLRYASRRLDQERREIEQGLTTGIQFRNMAPGHQIQQWSKANKANLIRFVVAEWKTSKVN